jgi:putative holliday junction resolvase
VTNPEPVFPVIALDVGLARIGFAASDSSGRFAFGRGYHTRVKLKADIEAVKALMTKESARAVVVGLPLRTDGQHSGQTQRVRAFAKDLERAGLIVFLQDERFSTKLADARLLVTTNRRDRLERGLSDEASAVLILETFLERMKQQAVKQDEKTGQEEA